jgi:hypothetical protein
LVIIAAVDLVHLRHHRRTLVAREHIYAAPVIALLRGRTAITASRRPLPGVAPSAVTRRGLVPAAAMPEVRTRMPDSVRKARSTSASRRTRSTT